MNVGDFRLLAYFVEVVRAGSIRGGARRLQLSPAVVSTAIRDLEAAIGVSILQRTTRSMALTDAGQEVFDRAIQALEAAETAMLPKAGEPEDVRGRLAVTLPVELAFTLLPSLLRGFEENYPEVDALIHAEETPVNLARSDFDAALRAVYRTAPDRSPNVCANLPLELVAAPQFAGAPSEDLQNTLNRSGFIGSRDQVKGGLLRAVSTHSEPERHYRVEPKITVNNQLVAKQLAVEGFGAALLISTSVETDLSDGRLVRLVDPHSFGHVAVRILMRDRFPTAPAIAFKEFVLGSQAAGTSS